jgi:hypothetical protein
MHLLLLLVLPCDSEQMQSHHEWGAGYCLHDFANALLHVSIQHSGTMSDWYCQTCRMPPCHVCYQVVQLAQVLLERQQLLHWLQALWQLR